MHIIVYTDNNLTWQNQNQFQNQERETLEREKKVNQSNPSTNTIERIERSMVGNKRVENNR